VNVKRVVAVTSQHVGNDVFRLINRRAIMAAVLVWDATAVWELAVILLA
jgi:hypothetical protein